MSSRCSPCCGCGGTDSPAPADDTKPPASCKGPGKGPAKGQAKEEPEDDDPDHRGDDEKAAADVVERGCAGPLHLSGGAAPLHDIEEEDNEEEHSSSSTLRHTGRHRGSTPSPTISQHSKSRREKKPRTRSVTSSTSTETSASSAPKMQAEQGSIGDLKTYHNRYLRSRRHTLANVR